MSIFSCALLALCKSSLEKCLFRSSAPFLIALFLLLLLSCMSCLYILEIKFLQVALLANVFFQSVGCLFILFMVSFALQKLISLIRKVQQGHRMQCQYTKVNCNEQVEVEFFKKPFIITPKEKQFGINLTKMYRIYIQNTNERNQRLK